MRIALAPLTLILLGCASTTAPDEAVSFFAAVLLSRSGPSEDFEHAGFLTRDPDGSLALVEWTFEHTYRRAVWRGAIPETAIAVIHTHPSHLKLPSLLDVEEAVRVRMPFIVVTRRSLCIASIDRQIACSPLSVSHGDHAEMSHLRARRSGTIPLGTIHDRPSSVGSQ